MTGLIPIAFGVACVVLFLFFVVIYAIGELSRTDKIEDRLSRFAPAAMGQGANESTEEINRKRIQVRVKRMREANKRSGFAVVRFKTALLQAGVDMTLQELYLRALVTGAVGTIAILILGAPILTAIPAFILFAYFVPLIVLKIMIRRRQDAFTKQFPDALDMIGRGLKSGLPTNECFAQIARESDSPVKEIFERLVNELALGVSMENALMRIYERMPTTEMMFFVTVVNISEETGGNLSQIINNISALIRKRIELNGEIRTKSAQARQQGIILCILPFLLALVLWWMDPNLMKQVFNTTTGQLIVGGFFVWLGLGIFAMWRIIAGIKV